MPWGPLESSEAFGPVGMRGILVSEKKTERSNFEPGKKIRVGSYRKRLSKRGTWQEGPHPSSEERTEGI